MFNKYILNYNLMLIKQKHSLVSKKTFKELRILVNEYKNQYLRYIRLI